MSYNTDLQSNNAELQEILDAVNALPEAGGIDWGTLEVTGGVVRFSSDTPSGSASIAHGLSGIPKGYLVFRTINTKTDTGLVLALGYNYERYNTTTGGSLTGLTIVSHELGVQYQASFIANSNEFWPFASNYEYNLTANRDYYWLAWR